MTTTTDAKTVPLTKLVPSPANMRRLNSEAGSTPSPRRSAPMA